MKLVYQNRTGVNPEHQNVNFWGSSIPSKIRMTIPARERIEAVAKNVDGLYIFPTPPKDIIFVLAPTLEGGAPTGIYSPALRCLDEPHYPGERPSLDMWLELAITPCPKCGAALVWYEAGYVPGYRICAGKSHHHYMAKFKHNKKVWLIY